MFRQPKKGCKKTILCFRLSWVVVRMGSLKVNLHTQFPCHIVQKIGNHVILTLFTFLKNQKQGKHNHANIIQETSFNPAGCHVFERVYYGQCAYGYAHHQQ
ncbi:Uncharacterised protein [Alysiella crassa]|uniref:Uncharacterized protein n=1 Tax=Alysiella crassa TaxID=153491 RepID=A0A376BK44_9NEIS|nr:Uncharacterised protein [Alysiella crassa]